MKPIIPSMRKVNDREKKKKEQEKIMMFIVVTNADQLECRPLVPKDILTDQNLDQWIKS